MSLSRRSLLALLSSGTAVIALGEKNLLKMISQPAIADTARTCDAPTNTPSPPSVLAGFDVLLELLRTIPKFPMPKETDKENQILAKQVYDSNQRLSAGFRKAYSPSSPLNANRIAVYLNYARPIINSQAQSLRSVPRKELEQEVVKAFELYKQNRIQECYSLPNLGRAARNITSEVAKVAKPISDKQIAVKKLLSTQAASAKAAREAYAQLLRNKISIHKPTNQSNLSQVDYHHPGANSYDVTSESTNITETIDSTFASLPDLIESGFLAQYKKNNVSSQSGLFPSITNLILGGPAHAEIVTATIIALILLGILFLALLITTVILYNMQLEAQIKEAAEACKRALRAECEQRAGEILLREEDSAKRREESCRNLAEQRGEWFPECGAEYQEAIDRAYGRYLSALSACQNQPITA